MSTLSLLASVDISAVTNRVTTQWVWYVIRGAGFTAAGILVLQVLMGIGQVTGIIYRFIEPLHAWVIHKALAIALAISIAIHGIFLLFDKFLPFSIVQILVPFASTYSNKSTLLGLSLGFFGVTAGILAMYGIVIIIASSLGWIDTKKSRWRKLHYLSYAVALLVIFHALTVGSDLRYGGFRVIWILIGILVVLGIIARLYRAGSTRRHQTTHSL